jgi:hypothetical protein
MASKKQQIAPNSKQNSNNYVYIYIHAYIHTKIDMAYMSPGLGWAYVRYMQFVCLYA